jgi:hypothetical protein
LYKELYPGAIVPTEFLKVCHKITVALNENPEGFEIKSKTKNLIKDVIYYLVHSLRDASEYGTDIDKEKKEIILDLEILAKEYFDTLKNNKSENASMWDIENAWQKERRDEK